MKTKVNRPSGEQQRDTGVTRLIQSWYDTGYEDALTDQDQENLFTQTDVNNECWKAEVRLLHSIQTGEYDISHLFFDKKKEEKPVYPILEEDEEGNFESIPAWQHQIDMEILEIDIYKRLEKIEDEMQQRADIALKFRTTCTERLIRLETKANLPEVPWDAKHRRSRIT